MNINTKTSLSPLHTLQRDLPAGVAVFLVSLPLCLGIALASGAPLISGMIAGIVGGIVVGFISQSSLGVSGPGLGLTVLVLSGVEQMGFSTFLLAIIFAGVVQIGLSFLRAGIIGYYFPSTVISGMLFGIGVIIILKQIPHALGYDEDYEGDMSFIQADGYNTLSELSHISDLMSPTAMVIAAVAFYILIQWDRLGVKQLHYGTLVPRSLIAVISGILINQLLIWVVPGWALDGEHLVTIPLGDDGEGLFSQLVFPDFSGLTNPSVYSTGFIVAIVASLESLLSSEATDKLDPYKRTTNTNRELLAQGIGNITSGLLGGLPIAQVIVRGSTNIQAKARTKASTIFHGCLLLISMLIIPGLLNKIPLAALASILIVVGFKLVHPRIVIKFYRSGPYQFVPFIATATGLIFTDLLTGVAIGCAIALCSIVLENYRMGMSFNPSHNESATIVHLAEQVTFLNKANITQVLRHQPPNSELIINAMSTRFIDYDIREIFNDFSIEAKDRNIDFKLIEMPPTRPTRSKIIQQNMTPAEALQILKEGNRRFVNNLHSHHDLLAQVNTTSSGQFPFAIILTCIDSRTSAELIFDQGLGDIFSVRVAGNVVNEDILGSMEYACNIAGSKLIMVLGHSHCGAIDGACSDIKLENLTGLLDKIKPAIHHVQEHQGDLSGEAFVDQVAKENVRHTMQRILQLSQTLKTLDQENKIDIVGGMYNIESGEVEIFSATEASP